MTRTGSRLALVIGATGGVGGSVADRLLAEGWRVRALNRDPATARQRHPGALEWVRGDAMVEADVVRAAEGADIIVHGANPPGYRRWSALAMPMLASTIAAARAHGGRILFPGTVYNFGPEAFPRLLEDAPQAPLTRKGKIRVQMESALARAAQDGVRSVVLRAGDYFGASSASNWFSQGLVRPGRPLTSLTYPGPLGVRHAWGYLPDVAETFVRLASSPDLADFEVLHLRGHEMSGHDLVQALQRVVGRKLAVWPLPWFAVRAAAPFNETMREMLEMTYLWRTPVMLDNTRLVARLGREPHTPLDAALRATLASLGCLPAAQAPDQRLLRKFSSARRDSVESFS